MKLYVGNLAWSIDDQALEAVFEEFGPVTSAKVITDRQTNRSRGFGFVELETNGPEAIEALDGKEVDGRNIVVNEAKPRD